MRVIILGSGRGSNAEAILQAQQAGRLGRARVVGIVSDRADAGILTLGPRFGVPAVYVDPAPFKTKLEGPGEDRFIEKIRAADADLVVLAGFMRVLSGELLDAFPGRVINIHPALLPAFPGVHGVKQAYDAAVKIAGCTVHFVDRGVDTGPIIAQAAVQLQDDDDDEALRARILAEEHRLLPAVVRAIAERRVVVEGRRVRVLGAAPGNAPLRSL